MVRTLSPRPIPTPAHPELTSLPPPLVRRQAADVLSRYTDRGLSVRVFDKRSAKLDNGASCSPRPSLAQADGS